MDVARLNNLSRIQRCGQIMGRAEAGEMSSAQIFYPCMQVRYVYQESVEHSSGSGRSHGMLHPFSGLVYPSVD